MLPIESLCLIAISISNVCLGSLLQNSKLRSSHQISGKVKISDDDIVDIEYYQIWSFPLTASVSLLMFFYLFRYIQYALTLCTTLSSVYSVQHVTTTIQTIYFKSVIADRYSSIFTSLISLLVVIGWLYNGNLWCHNIIGSALSIFFISSIRVPSFKLACLCLLLLLIYDIYWVFFSQYHFNKNVMLEVAMMTADNPLRIAGEVLHIDWFDSYNASIDLPIKLIFPSFLNPSKTFMIGLGDIEGQLKIYESSNPSQGTFNCSPQHIINMHGRGIKTVKFSCDC